MKATQGIPKISTTKKKMTVTAKTRIEITAEIIMVIITTTKMDTNKTLVGIDVVKLSKTKKLNDLKTCVGFITENTIHSN